MKKVLFIVPFLSNGGAEKVVSIWSSELAKLGINTSILLFFRVDNEYVIDKNIKIHVIKNSQKEYDKLTKWQKIRAVREKVKKINPDVVLPFITHVGIMTTIATIGLPVKLIETIRIDPRYSPKSPLIRKLRDLSIYMSDGCIVQNQKQKLYFPKFIRQKIKVLPNPISNEFIKKKKVFNEKKIKNIIAVGRLEEQKNYPMLINAISMLILDYSEIRLRIYGEGSLYEELSNIIRTKGLTDVITLCGRTTEIREVLLESDLFVLSSNAEGMPNALMEAMAVGLPCISTNCPTGPSDLIEDGVNGYLIPVGDEIALLQIIKNMVNNIDESIEMGKKAREKIINNYLSEVSAKNLLAFIESI